MYTALMKNHAGTSASTTLILALRRWTEFMDIGTIAMLIIIAIIIISICIIGIIAWGTYRDSEGNDVQIVIPLKDMKSIYRSTINSFNPAMYVFFYAGWLHITLKQSGIFNSKKYIACIRCRVWEVIPYLFWRVYINFNHSEVKRDKVLADLIKILNDEKIYHQEEARKNISQAEKILDNLKLQTEPTIKKLKHDVSVDMHTSQLHLK